ncbi:metallophosphoesterase [Candidatus Cloacimonadota bacterium]
MDSIYADYTRPITDGPYLIFQEDSLLVLEIESDSLKVIIQDLQEVEKIFINSIGHSVNVRQIFSPSSQFEYQNVAKYLVVSDIHGQFGLFRDLLLQNGIIDDELNWNWGTGHLVIAGDVFDRGEEVTESIWLIYSLSQQAEFAGGKVHFLMGNHELMIIENDLRYVNGKYYRTAGKLDMKIEDLYAENTMLGRWLRSRPVLVQINSNLIVHAGISPNLAAAYSDPDSINIEIRQILSGQIANDEQFRLLTGSLGPFWYRGYFTSSSKYDKITAEQYSNILSRYNVDKIIVGHTSLEEIYYSYNKQLLAVDASMKLGEHGKGLLFNNGTYISVDAFGNSTEIEELDF